jgi:hypothetical protein
MLYVALAEAVVLALTVVGFLGLLRSLTSQQAQERKLLMNQVFHAVSKPWAMPPSEPDLEPMDENADFELIPDIEQYPA